MQRLWREHQLNLKVLAAVLREQPEALALLQRIVDLLFYRPCVRCFSGGEGKAKCGSGAWLCGTCNRMFGRLHTVTDEGALWALARRVSVDPMYGLDAAQQHRQQHQQPRRS
ncbi:hypothetical protein OEZ85_006639 [Tetradesmus obliquus]|uniref:Uncharacterized protein n=1 Tax=Tetradesmus obliquus TaxID=3088 RepID=A0ABY8TV91_TETOB|nr:hypothetical protein OEZ85_006639 [Tetradesmus obliquus]